jgi:hypothetical protein
VDYWGSRVGRVSYNLTGHLFLNRVQECVHDKKKKEKKRKERNHQTIKVASILHLNYFLYGNLPLKLF